MKICIKNVRAIPEKNTWGGGGGGGVDGGWGEDGRHYIFLWVVGAERFQIIWVIGVRQIKLHGWLVFRCVEGEKRILSAKKERSFIKSS